jgi:uncharacterized protein (TIGR03118 family)
MANQPSVSFQTIALSIDTSEKVTAPAIVRDSSAGISVLSFLLSAEGDIPADGLIVTVDSNIQFRDNFAFLAERPFIQGGELVGAVFNAAGEATGFQFKMTQPNALFNLRPRETGDESAVFTLKPGTGYTVNAAADSSTVVFYETLSTVPAPTVVPEISLSSDGVVLNEITGNTSTITLKLSTPPPPEGVVVYIKGDRPSRGGVLGRALSEFDLFNAKVTGATFPAPDATANGFYIRVFEQTATLALSAFPNDEEVEGLEDVQFSLQPVPGYTINPAAKTVTLTTTDNATSQIQVSLTTSPAVLVESQKTTSVHTFTLSATPPVGGLVVSVVAPNINEFDLAGIKITDGEIVRLTPTGFDFNIKAKTAKIELPIANDGNAEGREEAIFTLQDAPTYQVNPSATTGKFQIVDTPDQAPPPSVAEPNDIISRAVALNLNPSNNFVSLKSSIGFSFGNSYPDGKGGTIYVDASEDVDMYKVSLKAGDTIKIDLDSNQFAEGRKVDTSLRVFNAKGEQVGFNEDGAAPDELFDAKWASYLDFTAPVTGDYYIGVAIYDNTRYDPLKPASGGGFSSADPEEYGTGDYTLNISLNDPNAFLAQPTAIPRGDGTGPAISLFTVAGTYGTDFRSLDFNIRSQGVAETTPIADASVVNFVLTADGDIPAGGVKVYITADSPILEYLGNRDDFGSLLSDKPFMRGGQFLEAIYDGTGTPIGFTVQLEESFATIAIPVTNRSTAETNGSESVRFSVIPSQGYTTTASSRSAVTFYDTLDQVPVPAKLPEVSLKLSATELIESAETPLKLTFSLSEPPPPGGVQVYVSGNAQDFLNEFSIFDAKFSGAVAVADGAVSGFYLKIFEQTATIELPVFNSTDIVEGIEEFNLAVRPGAGYTVNPNQNGGSLQIKDTPDAKIQVSLSTEPEVLIESAGTIATLNLNLSATPPAAGILMTIKAPEMIEFNPKTLKAEGADLVSAAPDNTSFTIRVRQQAVTLSVAIANDGKAEGVETATFSIEAGVGYQVNPEARSGTFTIVDTPDQVPPSTEESNDTLATAIATGLSANNRTVTFEGEIGEYEVGRGANRIFVDGTEDVDIYKVELGAGDKLTIDIDAVELKSKLQFAQIRIFDAAGIEVLKTGGNYFQAAPQEVFSVFNDTFAEYVATKPGTYYVGISNIGNDYYDPNVVGSGSGWIFPGAGIENGKYSVQFDVAPAPIRKPEVSFSLSPTQLNEAQGTVLSFNFNVTGTIPPEGLTVKLNGDVANTLLQLLGTEVEFESPTETELEFFPDNVTVQGGSLGVIDPDFASFTFTITEATASIKLQVFNDILEESPIPYTYTLANSETDSYTVNPLANTGTFTIVDGVPGGVGPTVGITANQTALYEDENTLLTLSFAVNGVIPPEGVTVFVNSTQGYGAIGALGQFDVFAAQVSGGQIVGADEDASGFFFKITASNATITVPIAPDLDVEAPLKYVFSLIDGEKYQVNPNAAAVNFVIADSAPFNILTDTAKVDYLAGSNGKDAIYGLDGFNSLYGNGGNDVIVGGKDGDLIFGGDGNDLIVGGKGSDVLFGGAGVDTFAYRKGDGGKTIADLAADIISDFKVGEDKIGVIKGEIAVSDIAFEQKDTATLVKVKSSGEVLAWLQNVTASSLNASSVVEVINQPITPNNTYAPTILVSNRQEYNPQIFDPTFALGWGLAIRPAGFGGHFWVTANGSGASYEYVGDVNIGTPNAVPLFQDDLKLVKVPGPGGTQGTPTGVVFNGSNNFVITQPYEDLDSNIIGTPITGPSRFLFATDTGTISAWTELRNADGSFTRSLTAKIVIDNSERGDQYFGLAVNPTGDRLFVANFGANPNVQVFDGTFKDITTSFNGFANPFVGNDGFQPGEYAPFNIQVLEAPNKSASVFVAYAKTQEDPDNPGQLFVGEEEAGPGLGRVAEFDLSGQLIRTWNDNGLLNSPWGFAYAPSDFGGLSNTLLVSNFSDGTITAFDTTTGNAIDYLRDTTGQPSVQRGIWGILFGNGASLGDTNSLYAAVGPEDIGDGIFSRLNYVSLGNSANPSATSALLPAPSTLPSATSLTTSSLTMMP